MLPEFGKLLRAIVNGPDPARIPPPTEVLATIDLSSPPIDWLWPQGIYVYTGFAQEAALAANRSKVALSNPTGSQTLVTVERILAISDNRTVYVTMALAADVTAFDSDGTEYTRDVRTYRVLTNPQPSRAPAAKILSDQAAAVTGQLAALLQPIAVTAAPYYTFEDSSGFVLCPGSVLCVQGSADQKLVECSFWWRERSYDVKEVAGSAFA